MKWLIAAGGWIAAIASSAPIGASRAPDIRPEDACILQQIYSRPLPSDRPVGWFGRPREPWA